MRTLEQLFDESLKRWGLNSQILLLAEESGELAVASLHLLRTLKPKAKAFEAFACEIADVQFLLDEMFHYFPNLKERVAERRARCELRLNNILDRRE